MKNLKNTKTKGNKMNKKTLEQVLENISCPDSDCISEGELQKLIQKEMPDWNIETWDMDDWNTTLTQSVADTIISEVQEGNTNIQYAEWNTDNMDAYFAILATKKGE